MQHVDLSYPQQSLQLLSQESCVLCLTLPDVLYLLCAAISTECARGLQSNRHGLPGGFALSAASGAAGLKSSLASIAAVKVSPRYDGTVHGSS